MTAKEYLNQAYRLEQRIKLVKMEIEELQELSCCVSSPGFEEHYNATRNTDAPFVKALYKIMKMQEELSNEMNRLLQLKDEINHVIMELKDQDEKLVLRYRYLYNYTWSRIADEMHADERTVRRWHNRALSHICVPSNINVPEMS